MPTRAVAPITATTTAPAVVSTNTVLRAVTAASTSTVSTATMVEVCPLGYASEPLLMVRPNAGLSTALLNTAESNGPTTARTASRGRPSATAHITLRPITP